MKQNILSLLLVLASSSCTLGAENPIPERLKPLASMLGKWTGKVETKITHEGKTQILQYDKTTTSRIGPDGESIVMVDTELNPWTAKQATTSSVIRHDLTSNRYKAMVWGSDGAVRLFVLEVSGSKAVFKQIDCDEGTTLSSTVTMKDASLEEEGAMVATGENAFSVEWKIRYVRPETTKTN